MGICMFGGWGVAEVHLANQMQPLGEEMDEVMVP